MRPSNLLSQRRVSYLKKGYGEISLPVTEQIADEIISLPMYPELTREQIEYVAHSVRESL
jgi:dTDP-4-amino-4,6-dideoxygalactose transaminase